jgi:hypothetical protein
MMLAQDQVNESAPVKLNGRKVTTKVDWVTRKSKFYGHQWLIEAEAGSFCNALLSHNNSSES